MTLIGGLVAYSIFVIQFQQSDLLPDTPICTEYCLGNVRWWHRRALTRPRLANYRPILTGAQATDGTDKTPSAH